MASSASSVSRVTGGRPISPLLTEATIKAISAKVAKGVPMKAAAGSLGIPYRTFQTWLENGRREDATEPYASLAQAVEFAVDRYHASRIVHLHRVGADDPKVTMWELERRFKDDWGDPERGGVTVNVNYEKDPQWVALQTRILAALADDPIALEKVARAIRGGEVIEATAIELAEIEA